MSALRQSTDIALRNLVGSDPANIDCTALLQWLRERDEPDVLATWLAKLSASPTRHLRQFVAHHARTWTIGLATVVFREPIMLHDLLDKLPPRHPFKVALLERTVDLMRGIIRPDEIDLMLFALTSRRLRRDFRRLNRYVQDRAFPLFVPERGTPPFSLDRAQLKQYLKRDYSPDLLAKTFTLSFAPESADAARLQIARTAPHWSEALVSEVVLSRDACDQVFRRIEPAPYLAAVAQRFAREYMEDESTGRTPIRVHLLTRAIDAGFHTDRSALEFARTLAPGIDAARSPITLISRFSRLSDESKRRLVENRQFVTVDEQGNRETAWSDAVAMVSSKLLPPSDALELAERVLRNDLKRRAALANQEAEQVSTSLRNSHHNVGSHGPREIPFMLSVVIDSDARAMIQRLWKSSTAAPRAGVVAEHRQLLLALVARLDGDRRAKLVRHWVWLEPAAVCTLLESGQAAGLLRADVDAAIRWSLAQGEPNVLLDLSNVFERNPEWVPNPADAAADVAQWVASDASAVRAYARNLSEWMAVVSPQFRMAR